MRKTFSEELEKCRVRHGNYASGPGEHNAAFQLRCPVSGQYLFIIISDGRDWDREKLPLPAWEHVSVSLPNRCPTWGEMSWVKDQFFEEQECVVQFHPPKSEYVNYHPFVLHLWKPIGVEILLPPSITVGPK